MPASQTAINSPFGPRKPNKKLPHKHDPLCVVNSGLSSCYCYCAQCWDKSASKCICVDCRVCRAQERTLAAYP
jgi:hypothetical protein